MHDCYYPIDTEQEHLISGEDPDNKEDVKREKNSMRRALRQKEFKARKGSKWCRGCDKTLDVSEFDFNSGDLHRGCKFVMDSISTIVTATGVHLDSLYSALIRCLCRSVCPMLGNLLTTACTKTWYAQVRGDDRKMREAITHTGFTVMQCKPARSLGNERVVCLRSHSKLRQSSKPTTSARSCANGAS